LKYTNLQEKCDAYYFYHFKRGQGVVAIANATVTPSINPAGGGVLYIENGALKYRGSNGTVTIIAPA
jgi:hypothetical protein